MIVHIEMLMPFAEPRWRPASDVSYARQIGYGEHDALRTRSEKALMKRSGHPDLVCLRLQISRPWTLNFGPKVPHRGV